MPFLAREFHLLPWYFGGDEYLTYREADVFLEAARRYVKEQEEQERKMKRKGRRR